VHLGISIEIHLPETAVPAAKELADALVEWSEQYVRDASSKRAQAVLQQAQSAVAAFTRSSGAAEQKYHALRDKLRDLTGRIDVSSDAIGAAVTRLETERQKLQLDALAKSARREALEQAIAESSQRIEQRVAADPIAAELQKVVDARQLRVDSLKKLAAAAATNQTEVSDGIAAAAEARAKLLQRRHDAAAESGGSALDGFNHELMTISIDSKELSAKLDYLKKQLDGLRQASDEEDSLKRLETDATQAHDGLDSASHRLRDIEQQIATRTPPHIVIKESNTAEGH
jgi:chromosome segregation ATPase